MSVQETIKRRITENLHPLVFEIENESHRHSGPAAESHFKLTVVSEEFSALSRVQRHQQVYQLLSEQLKNGVHALALHLYSPQEWKPDSQAVPDSPDCRGGS